MQMSFLQFSVLASMASTSDESSNVGVFFLKSLFIGDILLMHYSFFQGWDTENESGEAVCWCSQVHYDLPQTRPWQWREWREVSQEQCSTLHCLSVWVGARHLGAKTGVLWYPEGCGGQPCDTTVHSWRSVREICLELTGWCSWETSKVSYMDMIWAYDFRD